MNLKFVLQNEIDRKRCTRCFSMWIRFKHGKQQGMFRLGHDAPENCPVCHKLDTELEEKAIITSERWIDMMTEREK